MKNIALAQNSKPGVSLFLKDAQLDKPLTIEHQEESMAQASKNTHGITLSEMAVPFSVVDGPVEASDQKSPRDSQEAEKGSIPSYCSS